MRRLQLAIISSAALVAFIACGGSGGGNPTSPEPPVLANRQVTISFGVQSASGAKTLQEAELLWDDRVIARLVAAGDRIFYFQPRVDGVAAGTHSLAFRLVRQSKTPTVYLLESPGAGGSRIPNVVVINAPGMSTSNVRLPLETVSMRTGDVKRFAIAVP